MPIVLLDEPTSALDQANERLVTAFIQALPAGKTVIVVSHRREVLATLDRVMTLDGGQLVPLRQHRGGAA